MYTFGAMNLLFGYTPKSEAYVARTILGGVHA
jgi:hypothetical protein